MESRNDKPAVPRTMSCRTRYEVDSYNRRNNFDIKGQGHDIGSVLLPLNAITIDTRKKPTATMAIDSRHVRPMAMIPLANCHVAAL